MYNIVLGNPPEKENNRMFNRKNMVEYKQLAKEGASAAVSAVAADTVGDKFTSPMLAEKILGSKIQSSPTKISLYRVAQALSDVLVGVVMGKASAAVAGMTKMSKDQVKGVERAAVIGGASSGALKLVKIKEAFGDNAKTADAVLAEEKARLPVATSGFLTSRDVSTKSYLTSRNVRTNSYLTAKNATPTRVIGTSKSNLV